MSEVTENVESAEVGTVETVETEGTTTEAEGLATSTTETTEGEQGTPEGTEETQGEFDLDSFLEKNSIPQEQGSGVRQAIEDGIAPEAIQYQIDAMNREIATEREKLSPELATQVPDISNWIGSIEDAETRDLYNLMATKAKGIEELNSIRTQALGATGASPNKMVGATGGMDVQSFIKEFNNATNSNDTAKLASLKEYAKNSNDPVYKEFMLID